jgi:hypothetical protein
MRKAGEVQDTRSFNNPTCHCEPFAFCYSEYSEESHGAQDRLREAISLRLSEIASPDKSGSQ